MRRLFSAALVLALSAVVAPAGAATALERRVEARAAGRLSCGIGVVGFDSTHHIRSDLFTNGRLDRSRVSRETLPFDVTAFGFFSSSGTSKRNRLQLNLVTDDGVPRSVVLTRTPKSVKLGKATKYQQRRFSPRLFADGGTFYAYTVDGGTMKRWTLTRYPNGDVRFAHPVKVGGGFASLTSLTPASIVTVRGTRSELLYATDTGGRLLQIAVPIGNPHRAHVRRLAASGYDGVTELSWSFCNGKADFHTLIAIAPLANRATWTTIKNAFTRPRSTLQGDVTGVTDWNLSAAF